MDVKILAKVIAIRSKKIIQTGFISDKSTSMNIRRVYLNLQIPTAEEGSRAILSLNAVKTFNSLEWGYLWKVLAEFPVWSRDL